MDIIWLLIVGIFIAVLAFLVLKDISSGLAGLAAFIAVIMLIAIISISGSEREKAIMKKDRGQRDRKRSNRFVCLRH